jgi:D-amino-acid dehydrogenase
VGTGLGAAGLTIGPFAGRLLAELLTDRPVSMDLGPFDPMRAEGAGSGPSRALR